VWLTIRDLFLVSRLCRARGTQVSTRSLPTAEAVGFLISSRKAGLFFRAPHDAPSTVVLPMSNAGSASNLVHCGCCAVLEATDTAPCITRHRQPHAPGGMMDLNAGPAEAVCAER